MVKFYELKKGMNREADMAQLNEYCEFINSTAEKEGLEIKRIDFIKNDITGLLVTYEKPKTTGVEKALEDINNSLKEILHTMERSRDLKPLKSTYGAVRL